MEKLLLTRTISAQGGMVKADPTGRPRGYSHTKQLLCAQIYSDIECSASYLLLVFIISDLGPSVFRLSFASHGDRTWFLYSFKA